MYTIGFNLAEKNKLLEILRRDGSPEAQEFIYRVNTTAGFCDNLPQDCFNYYHKDTKHPQYYTTTGIEDVYGGGPSGIKWMFTGDPQNRSDFRGYLYAD